MNKTKLGWVFGLLLAASVVAVGCSSDSPTEPDPGPPPDPVNLPAIPEPSSVTELMPAVSASVAIGMSNELEVFEPRVNKLQLMKDDGSLVWTDQNRHLMLACPDHLTSCSACDTVAHAEYMSGRPRLLHTRHWRRLEQNRLDPGTSFTLVKTISWGTSTTDTHSSEFSTTMGIETTAGGGWGPFSASVTASYEQTTTETEIHSVTFSNEESEERTYDVTAPATGTRVYVLWQLVDEFSLVDADTIPISESPTLEHVQIPAITHIQFPHKSVITMQTTDFD